MNGRALKQAISLVEGHEVERFPLICMYSGLNSLTPCIFLYEGPAIGHWCAILKHKNSWEVFDPIGLWPDDELKHPMITKVPAKIEKMAASTNLAVFYNHMPLQKAHRTCGLWCCFRWIHRDLDYDQFIRRYGHITDLQVCYLFDRLDLFR